MNSDEHSIADEFPFMLLIKALNGEILPPLLGFWGSN